MISIRKLVWCLFCLVSSPSLKTKVAAKKIKEDMPKPFPKDYELVRFWIHQILILSCVYQILNSPVLLNCKKLICLFSRYFFQSSMRVNGSYFVLTTVIAGWKSWTSMSVRMRPCNWGQAVFQYFSMAWNKWKQEMWKNHLLIIGNIILLKSQEPLLGLHW